MPPVWRWKIVWPLETRVRCPRTQQRYFIEASCRLAWLHTPKIGASRRNPKRSLKSLAEWPGQGWTESIAERRFSALDAVPSRADAQATGRRLGGEMASSGEQPLLVVGPVQPGREAVGVRAGAPAPERGGPCGGAPAQPRARGKAAP